MLKSIPTSVQNRPWIYENVTLGCFGPRVAPKSIPAVGGTPPLRAFLAKVVTQWSHFMQRGAQIGVQKTHFWAKHVTFNIQNCTMEQWSEKTCKTTGFLAKISMVWYGWMLKKHCKYSVFFDIQRFLNCSNNYANMTLKSTAFWPQLWTLGVRKLIVRLFWDVFGRCWKIIFFWCCFWEAKYRTNRGLGRPRAAKVTSRVRRRYPLAILGPQGGPPLSKI